MQDDSLMIRSGTFSPPICKFSLTPFRVLLLKISPEEFPHLLAVSALVVPHVASVAEREDVLFDAKP